SELMKLGTKGGVGGLSSSIGVINRRSALRDKEPTSRLSDAIRTSKRRRCSVSGQTRHVCCRGRQPAHRKAQRTLPFHHGQNSTIDILQHSRFSIHQAIEKAPACYSLAHCAS